MRLSKRDFLKTLGFGGPAAGLATDALGRVIDERPALPPKAAGLTDPPRIGWAPPLSSNWYDAVDHILYDRVRFLPGAIVPCYVRMFAVGIGQIDPYNQNRVKTPADTNMDIGGCLCAPSHFWAKRIHVAVNPDIAREDFQTVRNFYWSLCLLEKRYAGGPMATDIERRSLEDLLKGKSPAVRQSLEFHATKGLFIPSQYAFHGEVATANWDQRKDEWDEFLPVIASLGGTGIEFSFTLEGILFRPVQ